MPKTLMQSPRFGVALTSSTVSSRSSAARRSWLSGSESGKLQNAVVLLAQAQLARRAQHAVRFQAAQLRALDREAARQLRTDHRDGHLEPGTHVGRAANDLQTVRAVGRDLAHRQLVGIRVTRGLEHLADDDAARTAAPPASIDSTSRPGERELLGQLRRRHCERQ